MGWVSHASQRDESVGHALWRGLAIPFVLLNRLVLVGTRGFVCVEGWTWRDDMWMWVLDLTTIACGEVRLLLDPGRPFALAGILVALGLTAPQGARRPSPHAVLTRPGGRMGWLGAG